MRGPMVAAAKGAMAEAVAAAKGALAGVVAAAVSRFALFAGGAQILIAKS